MAVVGRQCCLRTAQSTANHFLQPRLSTRPPSSLAHVTALPSHWRSQLEHPSHQDQFDVGFLSRGKRLRCASCASVECQLVRAHFISQSGQLGSQILGHFWVTSSPAHFHPSLPCLPQQAAPITSKMAAHGHRPFLPAHIPSPLLCVSSQPDPDGTLPLDSGPAHTVHTLYRLPPVSICWLADPDG